MGVRITRYNNSRSETPDYEREDHVGYVLSSRPYTVRVSSDHAMIDSGSRLGVTVWDAEKQIVREDEYHTDDNGVTVTVDAPPDVQMLAAEYLLTRAEVLRLSGAIYQAQKWNAKDLAPGDRVQVVSGRKVPKGTYTVRRVGQGTYGWFADLQTTEARVQDRKVYTYVSLDHLRRADDPWESLDKSAIPAGWPLPFVKAIFGGGIAPWLVLCDWLDEQGVSSGVHVRNAILHGLVLGYSPDLAKYTQPVPA